MENKDLIRLISKDLIEEYGIVSAEIRDNVPLIITKRKITNQLKKALIDIFGDDIEIKSIDGNREEIPNRAFENILIESILKKATDLHIEPKERNALIRLRLDGILYNSGEISNELYKNILTHLKIRAKLNIAEKRLPQEGSFPFKFKGNSFDIRVSVIPTLFGEKVALRILPLEQVLKTLEDLGMNSQSISIMNNALKKRSGSIIVSGPTGSGKSSTLHVLANYVNKRDKNIVTIEDPIEIVDENLNQTQVNEEIGLTYSTILKKILRQDPDVILLGEIRDGETARLACEASLTGHLMFTTIHTKNCESIVLRLFEMKIEPYLIASSLNVLISQRLLRRLCNNCKVLKPVMGEIFGLEEAYFENGCPTCHYTGYSGRIGVFEVIQLSDETKNLIARFNSGEEIIKSIRRDCKKTLIENAVDLIKNGITSISEVAKIIE